MDSWVSQWLKWLSIFSLLFICWTLSLSLSPDRLCLDSQMVSDVTFVWGENRSYKAGSCQLLTRLHQPELGEEELDLVRHILDLAVRLDALSSALPGVGTPFRLQIRFDKPFVIKRSANAVELGANVAMAEGQFFKVVAFHWLQSNLKVQDRYPLEVLSDFFSAYLRNQYSFKDPTIDNFVDSAEPLRWNSYISSFADYCLQETRSVLHLEYCQYQNGFVEKQKTSSLSDVTIWGLRPFVSRVLWETFQATSLSGKSKFFAQILPAVSNLELSYPSSVKDIEELSHWTRDFVLEMTAEIRDEEFQYRLRQTLVRGGLSHPRRTDFVIRFDSYEQMLRQSPKSGGHSAAGISFSPTRALIWPQNRPVSLQLFDVNSRIMVYVSCVTPTFGDLSKYNVDKSVVIKSCDGESLDWSHLLDDDLAGFLKANSQPFVMLHHGSMKLAKKRGWLKMDETIKFRGIKDYQVRFQWKSLNKSDSNTYRPLAAINVITAIRPQVQM